MKHTLNFDSLHLSFGTHTVLNSIYMKCETGKVTGLLGRNGSGKSCLMKIVFGAMPCTHKSVRINDERLTGNYLKQRLIGYLPQDGFVPRSLPLRKVLDLFRLPADRVTEAFPAFEKWMDFRPGELSGGYARLFEAVVILLSPYKFCILDEPFSGLAPVQIEQLKELIDAQRSSRGILVTDHLHKHITTLADYLYVLVHGSTYPVKEPEELVRLGYLSSL